MPMLLQVLRLDPSLTYKGGERPLREEDDDSLPEDDRPVTKHAFPALPSQMRGIDEEGEFVGLGAACVPRKCDDQWELSPSPKAKC